MKKQPNSSYCFVCGLDNVASVKVRFYETVSDGGVSEVMALFSGQPCHQGYPGRMHGGVLTGVLDETIARAINFGEGVHVERWGITAELNTRFLHPVPLETEVSARGRILTRNRRMFTGSGEIYLPDGAVAVHAEGKFLIQPLGAISGRDAELPGWQVYNCKD